MPEKKNENSKTVAGLQRRYVGSATWDPEKLPESLKQPAKEIKTHEEKAKGKK